MCRSSGEQERSQGFDHTLQREKDLTGWREAGNEAECFFRAPISIA